MLLVIIFLQFKHGFFARHVMNSYSDVQHSDTASINNATDPPKAESLEELVSNVTLGVSHANALDEQ